MNAHLRAEIVSLDTENPISKTLGQLHDDIQAVALAYYSKYQKCTVYAKPLFSVPPGDACTTTGEPVFKFATDIDIETETQGRYHAVRIVLFCTKASDKAADGTDQYDVWDIEYDYGTTLDIKS